MTNNPKRIMIADDDEDINDLLAWTCVNSGYEVATAHDGNEVWEQLSRGSFDVLLIDLLMPGKTGLQVIEEIRGAKMDLPIVVISGYLTAAVRKKLDKLQVNRIFTKPMRMAPLMDCIKKVMDRSQTREPK